MSDTDNDSDFGPMPACADIQNDNGFVPRKRPKYNTAHERLYLNQLPTAKLYENSYMHRDILSFTVVTRSDTIITGSIDGHLKFWKPTPSGIEFVKNFRAHLEHSDIRPSHLSFPFLFLPNKDEICGMAINQQGNLLATISPIKEIKIFDVNIFDMINMITLQFVPTAVVWAFDTNKPLSLLAVSAESGGIYLFDGKGDGSILHTVSLHKFPVVVMKYNCHYDTVISVDSSGILEYWAPDDAPSFGLPKQGITWNFKSETDLYEFKRTPMSVPSSLDFSPDGQMFATYGLSDRTVRIWRFSSGKLIRKYDESLSIISEMQQAGTAITRLDDMEFGRRLALEGELEASTMASRYVNVIFDISSTFVIYPTLIGIKIVNIVANRVSSLIGTEETPRFLNVALYQGAPEKKKVQSLQSVVSTNPALITSGVIDPILVATAFKKNRFYLFTRREPAEMLDGGIGETGVEGRDHFNERPTKDELTIATLKPTRTRIQLASLLTIHTTMGDIHIRLFPDLTPRTVENFVTHAKNNYYNQNLFHRVIRGFIIQSGDPKGDGTGGESCWGGEFEDEILPELKFDRAGVLAMANSSSKNSNGSQFFITCASAGNLNGKHSIFGRVERGIDVVHAIERVQVDGNDCPLAEIRIVNISIKT